MPSRSFPPSFPGCYQISACRQAGQAHFQFTTVNSKISPLFITHHRLLLILSSPVVVDLSFAMSVASSSTFDTESITVPMEYVCAPSSHAALSHIKIQIQY